MLKNYEKLFSHLKREDPPEGLLERVIFAVEKEKQKRQFKAKIALISAFAVSIIAVPFSFSLLIRQISSSGFFYFIFSAAGNLSVFSAYWKDFLFAIAESIPVAAAVVFGINIVAILFVIKIFINKDIKISGY